MPPRARTNAVGCVPIVVAGVVLAAILVPQGMAYAELAGLPPVTGLYTTIACLAGYALFGPSRVLVLGPDSSVSPMILAAITPLLLSGGDPGKAIALAGMLALIVGIIEIVLGLGKLGFVADLLSSEVQVGYMNGLAVTIIVGQLPKLFGFSTDADSFFGDVREFFKGLDQTETGALLVGVGVLLVLLLLPRVTRRLPAVLVAVAGATVISAIFDLAGSGVATVGIAARRSAATLGAVDLGGRRAAAARRRARHHARLPDRHHRDVVEPSRPVRGEEVKPNQEMIGIGAANVAAGFFSGFAVSTSGSRTAVAEQSGAKTQLTGLVGAGVVAVLLLFLNSLLSDLPQSALAAVVIAAALSLMDFAALRRYARVRPSALVLSLVASVGVIVFGVLEGIVIAIVLSVVLFFHHSWWPHGAVLGQVDGVGGWHDVSLNPGATEVADIVVYRWEAPLFFANAGAFRTEVRELVRDRRPAWVVLQCEAITDIDVSAAAMLEQLDRELNAQGVHVAFVELRTRLQDLIQRYGLLDTLDRDHFYPTMRTALAAIRSEPTREEPQDG